MRCFYTSIYEKNLNFLHWDWWSFRPTYKWCAPFFMFLLSTEESKLNPALRSESYFEPWCTDTIWLKWVKRFTRVFCVSTTHQYTKKFCQKGAIIFFRIGGYKYLKIQVMPLPLYLTIWKFITLSYPPPPLANSSYFCDPSPAQFNNKGHPMQLPCILYWPIPVLRCSNPHFLIGRRKGACSVWCAS